MQTRSKVFGDRLIVKTPVLRFFGQTKRGQKACINVFDCFPYFYVEMPPLIKEENQEASLQSIAHSLEVGIYLLRKNSREDCQNEKLEEVQARMQKERIQFVHNISVEEKFPVYGFYPSKRKFLKIEMYDQFALRDAANLLREGAVLGTVMQPYEAHLSWFMKFFSDYCLGGNEYIKLSDYLIRSLPKLDQKILNNKTYYPPIFSKAAGNPATTDFDYGFLNDVGELQYWY